LNTLPVAVTGLRADTDEPGLACFKSFFGFTKNDGLDAAAADPAVDGAIVLDDGLRARLCGLGALVGNNCCDDERFFLRAEIGPFVFDVIPHTISRCGSYCFPLCLLMCRSTTSMRAFRRASVSFPRSTNSAIWRSTRSNASSWR